MGGLFAALTRPALVGATACLLAGVLTPLVRSFAVRFGWVARPTEERWGRRVTARLGGVAIFAASLGSAVLWLPRDRQLLGLLVGSTLVFGLGLLDDLRRLPPYTKLVAQLLIGCLVVTSGIRIELIGWSWLSIPLSVLWFVLVMNAFNLLDNMDGLAAGIGALAAVFCAVHGMLAGQELVTSLGALLAGACLGFLRFNFPPARIYMGDSGSHFLGLGLATLVVLGSWQQSTPLLSVLAVPVLVLAVPIFDTCFVTIQRLAHRQHPFTGGTDHVSHRLAILGLSVRQTVVALYGISAFLGVLSIVALGLQPLPTILMWASVLTGLLMFGVYLAKVNVYGVQPSPAPAASGAGITLIDTMLLHKRRLVEILVDFCALSSAYVFAFVLRFEGTLTGDLQQLIMQSLPVLLVVKLACLAGFGLYRGVPRYLGLADIVMMFKAVSLGSILSSAMLVLLWRFQGYSRAVLLIDWMLSFFAVGGSRVVERLLDEWIAAVREQGVPVVLIGAGDTGEQVLRCLRREAMSGRRVVAFLDDDRRKHGTRIHGVSVLGGRTSLAGVIDALRVREVLIAINDPPGELLEHVRACCTPRGVPWRVVTAGIVDAV